MKINKLGFMSLLALLGILGILTENKGFLGFFGFIAYIRYFKIIPDELFRENVKQAGSIGFFTGISAASVSIALYALFNSFITPAICFAIGFVASIFSFTLVLTYLEYREQWGM
jgi:hypothetical protein